MAQLFYAANINAAQNDKLQLEIGVGKPAASPNVAVINEELVINFKVWVIDTETRKEVMPLNIKQCVYKLECPSGVITKVEPTMTIATDKHSATLTDTKLHPDIKQSAKCATKGKLKSTLNVKIIFNDNSFLSKNYAIEIDITDATVTVYAKKPDKIVMMKNNTGKFVPCYVMNDPGNPLHDPVGHSFWRTQVDENIPTYSVTEKDISGEKYGFYPKNPLATILDLIFPVQGEIKNDNTHEYDASKSYSVTVENAKNVISKTDEKKKDNNLKYQIICILGENCTSVSVDMCNKEGGGTSPDGKGEIGVVIDEHSTLSPVFLQSIPNPYHHAVQLLP
jgi:hypothetical protein